MQHAYACHCHIVHCDLECSWGYSIYCLVQVRKVNKVRQVTPAFPAVQNDTSQNLNTLFELINTYTNVKVSCKRHTGCIVSNAA